MWLAVNEAQENGHIALSYAFMCEIKNIRQIWGKERCAQLTAEAQEWIEVEIAEAPKGELFAEVDVEEVREEYEARFSVQQDAVEREIEILEKKLQAAEQRAREADRALKAELRKDQEWRDKLRKYELKVEQNQ